MTLEKAKEIIAEISERKGKPIREPEQLEGEPEEAYKALALVLASAYRYSASGMAGWIAKNRHRFVPFLAGGGWKNAQIDGLEEWAEKEAHERGNYGLDLVLDKCFLSREEMGDEFLREIAENKIANILAYGACINCKYTSDVGNFRFRVDDGDEVSIGNGYGDGDFYVTIYPPTELPWVKKKGIDIIVNKSLDIAEFDTGDFSPLISLPAGEYRIFPADGDIQIVKLS